METLPGCSSPSQSFVCGIRVLWRASCAPAARRGPRFPSALPPNLIHIFKNRF